MQNHNKQHTNIYALKPPYFHVFPLFLERSQAPRDDASAHRAEGTGSAALGKTRGPRCAGSEATMVRGRMTDFCAGFIWFLEMEEMNEAPKIAKLVYNSNNYGFWYL